MLTLIQKKTAEAIVNIFETSQILGDYSMVTVIPGDSGHLTYGRSQTTLGSGNLYTLLTQYCNNVGARFKDQLRPLLSRFQSQDLSLDVDIKVHNLLRVCADDPVMRETQDIFFDKYYWQAAERVAKRDGISSPLGLTIVYDSFVHGSWRSIQKEVKERMGEVAEVGEEKWLADYVKSRRSWLAGHRRRDLRATVYRMDAIQRLIDQDYWGLELPLVVRGKEISSSSLSALPPRCFDGPQPGSRVICLQSPLQRGLDIRLLQFGMSNCGIDIKADGIFGRTSAQCLKKYQAEHNLPENGIADLDLIAKLLI